MGFCFFFKCVRGPLGCVLASSLVSRTWSRACIDQLFVNKNMFPRTTGNDLICMLILSLHWNDPSGTHLCPFSYFFVFCMHTQKYCQNYVFSVEKWKFVKKIRIILISSIYWRGQKVNNDPIWCAFEAKAIDTQQFNEAMKSTE